MTILDIGFQWLLFVSISDTPIAKLWITNQKPKKIQKAYKQIFTSALRVFSTTFRGVVTFHFFAREGDRSQGFGLWGSRLFDFWGKKEGHFYYLPTSPQFPTELSRGICLPKVSSGGGFPFSGLTGPKSALKSRFRKFWQIFEKNGLKMQ